MARISKEEERKMLEHCRYDIWNDVLEAEQNIDPTRALTTALCSIDQTLKMILQVQLNGRRLGA